MQEKLENAIYFSIENNWNIACFKHLLNNFAINQIVLQKTTCKSKHNDAGLPDL